MRLWAIGDLHLGSAINRGALDALPDHGEDWLILCGDICESAAHLRQCFEALAPKFARLIWVPGNHELWSARPRRERPGAPEKYRSLVELARAMRVSTPEDPYPIWPESDIVICPLFLLYDYSFRPSDLPRSEVVAWAAEEASVCADELMLSPYPYPDIESWCAARLAMTADRLDSEIGSTRRSVLINHFPLRRDLVDIPRIPRFAPWCGTIATEDWHRRYRAATCVSGHLHTRRTDWRDGTRFEEVSLGYPRQWSRPKGVAGYLRRIL